MALLNKQISSLIQGVSQQPDSIRSDSQAEEQINFFPSTALGIIKRGHSRLISNINQPSEDINTGSYMFTIDRPDAKYIVIITATGQVLAYDTEGNEQTVTFKAGFDTSYLTSSDASTALRHISIGDSVVLVNTEVEVDFRSDIIPDRSAEALIYVSRGEYGKTYSASVVSDNDALTATYTTPDGTSAGDATQTDSGNIASEIATQLIAGAGGASDDWDIQVRDNLILIKNNTGGFSLSTADGLDDTSMYPLKGSTSLFQDLPRKAPPGFTIAITGDEGNVEGQPYYVKAVPDGGSVQAGLLGWPAVVWEETIAPGLEYQMDETTLPCVIRRVTGGFEIGYPDDNAGGLDLRFGWGNRVVGDNDTAPFPSFVGRKINGGFFFKNRLAFFSGINVVLSESGDFFNFNPTATATLLATDPIDVALSSKDSSDIYHAVPFQNQVMLSTESDQFSLRSEGPLTLSTVNIAQTTSINIDKDIEPVSSGKSLFMAAKNGNFTEINEYFINDVVNISEAGNVTAQVPSYIPWKPSSIIAAKDGRHIALFEGDIIYVYKYLWNGNEKAQSAWFKVKLNAYGGDGDDNIVAIDFVEDTMFVLMNNSNIPLENKIVAFDLTDSLSDYGTDFSSNVYLDSRYTGEPDSYDAELDETVYFLPFAAVDGLQAIDVEDGDGFGDVLDIVEVFGSRITVKGNTGSVMFGYNYECSYKFSKFYMKDGVTAVTTGQTNVLKMQVNYADTSDVTVDVDIEGRSTRTFTYYGRSKGDINNLFGQIAIDSGVFSVPVNARVAKCNATLRSSSHLPTNIQFVDVVFRYNSNVGKRM